MSCFAVMRSPRAEINDTPIVDGQFFIETDQTVNNLYNDNGNNRVIIGRYDWTKIIEKPFETLGSRLTVLNNSLNADIQSWNIIDNKPFEDIGSGLDTTNHILSADNVAWSIVQDKPFETLGARLSVANDILSADIQSWNIITTKPFETVDMTNGRLSISNDIISADNQIWSDVTSKPFETLGIGLDVKPDGSLYATGGVVGGMDWFTKILHKPFETLGSTLAKNSDDELVIGTVNWSNIGVKPFRTVGSGLQVVNDALTLDSISWNNVSNKPFNTIDNARFNINADALNLSTVTWSLINYKPFETLGNSLSVDSNEEVSTVLRTIELSNVGTASDTNTSYQELVVNGTSVNEITGSKYMEDSSSFDPSNPTMFSFTNSAITTDSNIDVMTLLNNSNGTKTETFNIIPINVSVTNGQCVVTYPASELGSVTCRIYIL